MVNMERKANPLPHLLHTWGRAPECLLRWSRQLARLLYAAGQCGHLKEYLDKYEQHVEAVVCGRGVHALIFAFRG